jgi:ankyrin repeat protein
MAEKHEEGEVAPEVAPEAAPPAAVPEGEASKAAGSPEGDGGAQEEEANAVPRSEDIFLLARQQNFTVCLKLLEAYPQLWLERDNEGHSLLHWGALVGNKEFCAAGLSKGIPVDAQAGNRQTPLMWSVLRGHISVARGLLDAKANCQIKDSLGATALMIAIQHRDYRSVLLLMKRGGPNILADADNNGCTAAHWAAYKGDLTALKFLEYFNADMCALDSGKMMPLHRACCAASSMGGSYAGVVEFLIEKRADPQQKNDKQQSALDIVEESQDPHIQALLRKLLKKATGPSAGKGGQMVDPELGNGSPSAGQTADGSGSSDGKGEKKESFMKSMMKDKAAHKIFPCFWLVCVSLALFQYLIDFRSSSYQVAPTMALLFELCVPLSVAIFAWVALGDPGKLPSRAKGHSGVEEIMNGLDKDVPDDKLPSIDRLCTTTWVLKDLRTKYCAQTCACVDEFDHYCIWLNCAIGKNNHREFVGLALVEFTTQVVHIYLCWAMSTTLVRYQSIGSWLVQVIMGYPLLALIAILHCFTAPWVLMLIVHQSRLIMMNLTTNEMMNMHRYEHFWKMTLAQPGRYAKTYHNPFDKGGRLKNCLDFWWRRRRSSQENHGSDCCHGPGCAHGHGHHHH